MPHSPKHIVGEDDVVRVEGGGWRGIPAALEHLACDPLHHEWVVAGLEATEQRRHGGVPDLRQEVDALLQGQVISAVLVWMI